MRERMTPREEDGPRSPVAYHLDLLPGQTGQKVAGHGR
jgi:hypothetical protein